MKLAKTSLAFAIASVFALPAMAADVTIYGKANVSVQSSDEGDGSFTEVKSNASRIGFKGTHDLGNGLEVVYKAEFQVDLDGDSAKGDSITDRSQYVGLKGNFGEVLVGKNDTMLKQSQGKVDLFNDLNGDLKHLLKGDNRMADTITYISPKFNDIKFGLTYVAADSVDGEDAVSVAAIYGDKSLKKSNFYAALAHDNDVKGYDITRATFATKVSGFTFGAMYQTQDQVGGDGMDGYLLSVKKDIENVTLKAQYLYADHDNGETNDGFSVGADYKLAKNTKLYAFYTTLDFDAEVDEDYLGVGIEYKF